MALQHNFSKYYLLKIVKSEATGTGFANPASTFPCRQNHFFKLITSVIFWHIYISNKLTIKRYCHFIRQQSDCTHRTETVAGDF